MFLPLILSCNPPDEPAVVPATVEVELSYAKYVDDEAVCAATITWSGEGTASACDTCDFWFDVSSSTHRKRPQSCFEGYYGYNLMTDPRGGGGFMAYFAQYEWDRDVDAVVYGDYGRLFLTGYFYYRDGVKAVIDCDDCGDDAGFVREGYDLRWWASTSDDGYYGPSSMELTAVGTITLLDEEPSRRDR